MFVGKLEGKRPLGMHGRGGEEYIRMYLREIGMGRCGLDASGSG
jgi:hypothetical protein